MLHLDENDFSLGLKKDELDLIEKQCREVRKCIELRTKECLIYTGLESCIKVIMDKKASLSEGSVFISMSALINERRSEKEAPIWI